ncbi:MAG TPA: S8 family serine peptidase [Solirubrobacterales bacterium]|nr:S8 family serine peptidase [Solirubrobacterales bacterium]
MLRRCFSLACALFAMLAAPAAAAAEDQPATPSIPPTPPSTFSKSNVIVQWTQRADREDKTKARTDAAVTADHNLDSPHFQLVSVEQGQPIEEAIDNLEADPAVVLAERDSSSAPNAIPNDPLFGQLWGLRNLGLGVDGFSGAISGSDINALGAWARTVGTPSTVVADLDTGYRFEHPDLESVAWTNPGEIPANGLDDDADGIVDDIHGADFVGPNSDVTPVVDGNPTDEDLLSGGHGVHTAGTMGAAGNNGVGITGVAQNIRIMPLRVCSRSPSLQESRCPTSSQIAAINYAGAKGARVANMSLGGNNSSQVVVNAFASNPQTLYVISAGNDGSDNDGAGVPPNGHHYPCDYTPQTQASPPVPGAIDNIVCVAATNQADGLASFSDWGATSVDLGAPGTETLSTYPYVTPFEEQFTVNDFASKWPATGANGGFQRTNEAPLTSFGMTDAIGAAAASTVRETTSAPVTIPANGGCKLNQTRRVSLAGGDHYRYSVLLNGTEQAEAISEPPSTTVAGLDRRFLELPAVFNAGGEVQVRFRFTAGSAPAPGSGVWLDDISIGCVQAVGQANGYAFLQGTSMAAPHVTGAAALLFSRVPTATVTEVRQALLTGVDPVPSLTGKTVTGGRLDVSKAMDILESDVTAPDPPQLTSTVPASPANENHPKILGTAEPGSTVKVYADAGCDGAAFETGTAADLASPGIAVTVPDNSTSQFSARATDAALNTSSCSAPIIYVEDTPSETEIVEGPPDEAEEAEEALRRLEGASLLVVPLPPVPVCTVPRLAGMPLGLARAALASAHCTLGKVTKPRSKRGHKLGPLVVKMSIPAASAKSADGKVDLILAPKPKPRKHRH